MRRSREEAAETRRRIVKAAAREFREKGIVATGLTDLMKAAGLTHGGFYKHFDSKDQLVAEATAEALDTLLEGMAAHPTTSAAVAACTALLAFGGTAAQAAAPQSFSTAGCIEPTLTQPFAQVNDPSNYMLAPGQSEGQFQGTGWTLSGGAQIVQTTLPDGGAGEVLELPSGAKAVSPTICVTTAYPKARMLVRNVLGGDAVNFAVGYAGHDSWEKPRSGGDVHGNKTSWTLSAPVNMSPEHVEGWQLVQITLVAKGKSSNLQIDNLYIDPYRR